MIWNHTKQFCLRIGDEIVATANAAALRCTHPHSMMTTDSNDEQRSNVIIRPGRKLDSLDAIIDDVGSIVRLMIVVLVVVVVVVVDAAAAAATIILHLLFFGFSYRSIIICHIVIISRRKSTIITTTTTEKKPGETCGW